MTRRSLSSSRSRQEFVSSRGSATLTIRTCGHTEPCTCDRIEFRGLRPLTCSQDPAKECYGRPLGFDVDYWLDTMWGRLFRFSCSSCGYTNNVTQAFLGPAYRKVVTT